MGTIHITEHELVLIASALDLTCHILAGWKDEQTKIKELEDLRQKLYREWEEDEHENA